MAGMKNNILEFQLTVCHTSGKPKGLPRIAAAPFPLGKLFFMMLKSI
jgi:hypothetical protein